MELFFLYLFYFVILLFYSLNHHYVKDRYYSYGEGGPQSYAIAWLDWFPRM